MFYIDWTLRISSLIILVLIYMQFVKPKGNTPHVARGKWAMFLGIVIFACIFIRGMQNEHFSLAYGFHLLTGAPFFVFLFLTGRYGYLTDKVNEKYMFKHKACAYLTMISLVATLIMGIVSVSSH